MGTKKEDAFKELAPDCVASEDKTAEVETAKVVTAATTLKEEAVTEEAVLVVVMLAVVLLLTRGLASVEVLPVFLPPIEVGNVHTLLDSNDIESLLKLR